MFLKISAHQLRHLDRQAAARSRQAFAALVLQQWQQHFALLMPGLPAQPLPQMQALVDAACDTCCNAGVTQKPQVLQFAFATLRAAHLGCSPEFIREMSRYFLRHQASHQAAQDWIDHVLAAIPAPGPPPAAP